MLAVIAESLQAMQAQIALLDREIASRAKADPVAKRLMTIRGVDPVIATALVALAPAVSRVRFLRRGLRNCGAPTNPCRLIRIDAGASPKRKLTDITTPTNSISGRLTTMANESTASKPSRKKPEPAAASDAAAPAPDVGKPEKAPSGGGATAKPKDRSEGGGLASQSPIYFCSRTSIRIP